jgi:hypothetical protein
MKQTIFIIGLIVAAILIAGCSQPVQNVDSVPVAQVTMLAANGSYVPAPVYVPPYECHMETSNPPMGFTFPCNSSVGDTSDYKIEYVNGEYKAVYYGV